jgi:hypothetical protein
VPQYLLDEMIAEGRGGFCNIVCTQPRRIAVFSSSPSCLVSFSNLPDSIMLANHAFCGLLFPSLLLIGLPM